MRAKARTLRIGADVFGWRVYHRHREEAKGERCCEDVFFAFDHARPGCGVRIVFRHTPEHGAGYPGQAGVIVDYRAPASAINLNRPKVARLLIELAKANGWSDPKRRGELVIEDGFALVGGAFENGDLA